MKFKIREFFLLCILVLTLSLETEIYTQSDSQKLIQEIYKSGKIIDTYDYYNQIISSCFVPRVQNDKFSSRNRKFFIVNPSQSVLNLSKIDIKYDESVLNIKYNTQPIILNKNETYKFEINYQCNKDKDNYPWSIIEILLKINDNDINISYIKECAEINVFPFDSSYFILAGICIITIFIAAKHQQIITFQKKWIGIEVNFNFLLFYMTVWIITMIIWYIFPSETRTILIVIFSMMSLLIFTFVFKEIIQMFNLQNNCIHIINFPKIGPVYLSTLICLIISGILILIWFLIKNYILNDILAFLLIIACFKLIKINSLKQGTIFITFVALFEIFMQLVIFQAFLDYSLELFFSSDFCIPLILEVPTINFFVNKRCSWMSIGNIIFPGLFLTYFYRFDRSKHIRIYFLTGFFGYLLGNLMWIIVSLFTDFASPLLFYYFPFMIGLNLFLSYRRNENFELWNGLFYDEDFNKANLIEDKGNKDVFNKAILFEGLMNSERESIIETEENELQIIDNRSNSKIVNIIEAFNKKGFNPNNSNNTEEYMKVLKEKNLK